MRTETSAQTYVRDLEEHLQHTLFGGAAADPEGAVLLIRGALANGDQSRAELLALETARLAAGHGQDTDMAVAAVHAAGLVGRDPAALEGAAAGYSSVLARAWATEDAGLAWAERGSKARAAAWLRDAHALYERIGSADGMARVRSRLREDGIRLRHWTPADRPAFGWDSLTDTEQRVVELVADGLSNREVASRMFLSLHTVAFHLRHVFWKLGVSSRVELTRLAAERAPEPQADLRPIRLTTLRMCGRPWPTSVGSARSAGSAHHLQEGNYGTASGPLRRAQHDPYQPNT